MKADTIGNSNIREADGHHSHRLLCAMLLRRFINIISKKRKSCIEPIVRLLQLFFQSVLFDIVLKVRLVPSSIKSLYQWMAFDKCFDCICRNKKDCIQRTFSDGALHKPLATELPHFVGLDEDANKLFSRLFAVGVFQYVE